jgi:putative membrane protein
MLLEIIIFLFLGILFGTLTGLIPGIHINLVGVLLVSLSATIFFSINPVYFVVFISSMAITHTFIDFIPSIFLGCPDTDTELSILPGHELLKKGLGYEAIILTAYGSLAAIFILVLIAFPSILIISKTYDLLQKIIPYLLIVVSIFLIVLEKKKLLALVVFLLAGFLGWCVLNLNFLKEPLLPLLAGLFGASMLIMSIRTKTTIPEQKIAKPRIRNKLFKPLIGALVASPFSSFLPGLGSGQAAIIGNTISRTDRKGFLILLGATNTLVMGFSFVSLYIISRTRTGAAVAIQRIIGELSPQILALILATVIISGILSFFITIFLTGFFSQKINKINYSLLSSITLFILGLVILLFSGIFGLVVLIISTLTGIYCISLGVRRTQMMGALLLPTIIFYLVP